MTIFGNLPGEEWSRNSSGYSHTESKSQANLPIAEQGPLCILDGNIAIPNTLRYSEGISANVNYREDCGVPVSIANLSAKVQDTSVNGVTWGTYGFDRTESQGLFDLVKSIRDSLLSGSSQSSAGRVFHRATGSVATYASYSTKRIQEVNGQCLITDVTNFLFTASLIDKGRGPNGGCIVVNRGSIRIKGAFITPNSAFTAVGLSTPDASWFTNPGHMIEQVSGEHGMYTGGAGGVNVFNALDGVSMANLNTELANVRTASAP